MVELVSRDQILMRKRGQRTIHFPSSADHEQDWQPYPVDPYFAICNDYTYMHIYIYAYIMVMMVVDPREGPAAFDPMTSWSLRMKMKGKALARSRSPWSDSPRGLALQTVGYRISQLFRV